MAVLSAERDALAVQKSLHLLGMSGRMNAGQDDLILPQQGKLTGLQFLDLGNKVTCPIDFLHGVHQFSALFLILLVRKARADTGAALDVDLVAVAHNGVDFRRCNNGAVFAGFDIL